MAPLGSVLLTGCSDGGIGSALAAVFQQHGYLVFATAPDTKKMSKLAGLDNVKLLALDVRESDQIQAAVESVRKETGGSLNYLLNCAARNHYMPVLDENIDDAKKLYDINVWGPLALMKAFSPLVVEAKGTFVFITSVSGCLNVPYHGKYATELCLLLQASILHYFMLSAYSYLSSVVFNLH
jgi:1-acylglycerone phosphate reductase